MNRRMALTAPLVAFGLLVTGGAAQAVTSDEPVVKLTDSQKKEKAEKGFLSPTAEKEKARKDALKDWRNHVSDREPDAQGNNGARGKVLGSRKATKEDVQSGLASATTATIYLCSAGANLRDPITDTLVRAIWLGLGWEETTSSAGNPMARVNTGNAIIVHNDSTRAIFWSASQWENTLNSSAPIYGWARWYYNQTYYNVIGPNGGALGQRPLTTGYIDQSNPPDAWYNQEFNLAGYRTYITNHGDSLPDMDIYLWGSGSYANSNSHSEVFVEATNSSPCGTLHSFVY